MVSERLQNLTESINSACKKGQRLPEEIRIVAVSKRQSVEAIHNLYNLGIKDFGENYLQESMEKMDELFNKKIIWHFIGALQTKKLKEIVGQFEYIHTVSRIREVEKIDSIAQQKNIIQKIFLQINLGLEDSKNGILEQQVPQYIEASTKFECVDVCGLMTMPPFQQNPEDSRKYFAKLKELSQKWNLKELSMGTSQDFMVAIEEGATMIRVGTTVFGPRTED